jgi:hypothetical protein
VHIHDDGKIFDQDDYVQIGVIRGDRVYTVTAGFEHEVGEIRGDRFFDVRGGHNIEVGFIQGGYVTAIDRDDSQRRVLGPVTYPHPRWNAAAFFLLT